jgi:ribonuclease Z
VIDLMLLGAGAMMPLPERWLSCLLVRCEGAITLFDCGEGTQIPWRASSWGFRQTGAICLSHLHADHVAGIPGLLHTLANSERTEPVHIYGPEGTISVIEGLRRIAPLLPFEVNVQELSEGDEVILPGAMRARVIAGNHRVPSLIYRIDVSRSPRFDRSAAQRLGIPVTHWSRLQAGETVNVDGQVFTPGQVQGPARTGLSFGFMTDTRPVEGAASFLSGVDLLISEGTYGDSARIDKAIARGHMTFAEAATVARDAGAGQLWLTHFSPAMLDPDQYLENATSIFARTTLGQTGLSTTLVFRD